MADQDPKTNSNEPKLIGSPDVAVESSSSAGNKFSSPPTSSPDPPLTSFQNLNHLLYLPLLPRSPRNVTTASRPNQIPNLLNPALNANQHTIAHETAKRQAGKCIRRRVRKMRKFMLRRPIWNLRPHLGCRRRRGTEEGCRSGSLIPELRKCRSIRRTLTSRGGLRSKRVFAMPRSFIMSWNAFDSKTLRYRCLKRLRIDILPSSMISLIRPRNRASFSVSCRRKWRPSVIWTCFLLQSVKWTISWFFFSI
jgi:hypothetical protein